MVFRSHSRIVGFGAYLPEKTLTNADFERMVDTNDEWIVQRTGMHERHIARKDEFSSDLAIGAVNDLIARHGVSVDDVDAIIVTTFTPDHFSPTVSAQVQAHFGISGAATFDLGAGCTGFCYGVQVADALISAGRNRKILLIAAETVSKVVDYTDRSTCILFGDAGGACLIEETDGPGCVLGAWFHTDGHLAEHVTCPNHSMRIGSKTLEHWGIFGQDGQQVYKYVVKSVPPELNRLLASCDKTLGDIDWFVPHSANLRLIEALCAKIGYPREQMLTSVENHGNTSSATIPIALWLAQNDGRLRRGQTLLLYGFGGGLTQGGVVVEY